MGSQILLNLFYSDKLDKCKVTIRYSNYTWIAKHINWLCTCLPQAGIDMDVFVDLTLVMGVDGKRGKWFLKLKNYFMDSSEKLEIGLIL